MNLPSYCRQRQLFTVLSFLFAADLCLGIRPPFVRRIELPRFNSCLLTIQGGATSGDAETEVVTSEEGDISDASTAESIASLSGNESLEHTPIEPAPIEDPSPDQSQISGSVTTELSALKALASQKRVEGKTLHDSGDLASASEAFHEAAALFQRVLNADDESVVGSAEELEQIVEDFATCRLHEALCLFKNGQAENCIWVCSDVLGDDVVVGKSGGAVAETARLVDDNDNDEFIGDKTDRNQDIAVEEKETVVMTATTIYKSQISSQVRARAHLRRSKARLALGDLEGALEDGKHIFWLLFFKFVLSTYSHTVC